ncbi:MAG: hypothetical protein ACFB9M_16795 [Myxococcota bacterium]
MSSTSRFLSGAWNPVKRTTGSTEASKRGFGSPALKFGRPTPISRVLGSTVVFLFEMAGGSDGLDDLWAAVRAELEATLFGLDEDTLSAFRLALIEAVATANLRAGEGPGLTIEVRWHEGELQARVHGPTSPLVGQGLGNRAAQTNPEAESPARGPSRRDQIKLAFPLFPCPHDLS